MKIDPVNIFEKEEIKLVGFSVKDCLNNIVNNRVVEKLREVLVNRKIEVLNRKGKGIYLVQIYPDCQWTPDIPFENIVAIEVTSFGKIPKGMIKHVISSGRYAKFIHKGPESELSNTYDLLNEYSLRPFDFEYWHDIFTLDNPNNEIDIYMPISRIVEY